MKTLKDIPAGQTAKVLKVNARGSMRKRIMDMGLTRGCTVEVRKVAPLGDPIEVCLRGSELSIRKSEAETIDVE
jgi:ferrous iron transport protein A